MNKIILNIDIQDFIDKNLNSDIPSLILKGTRFHSVETRELIEQIESKKKSQRKLPTWFNTQNIYFPNKLNIEQTSSELTATYKSSLIEGQSIIDLTGGFGVDSYFFSKRFEKVIHCEVNEELSAIANHNFKQLKAENIETLSVNGIAHLQNNKQNFDYIYVDPSRRHESKGKVFFLSDCLPDIPKHLDLLFRHSSHILIKTSPLLDITMGLKELEHVKTLHVIAVNNEVKELLWDLEKNTSEKTVIQTINIKNGKKEHFSFSVGDETTALASYSIPLTYLYEPNAAILKAGGFQSVAFEFGVFKLQQHSHLYTSNELIDFPGRRFRIKSVIPYNKKQIKKLRIDKANVSTRNFPETVQQIRNSLKIKDGGTGFLLFTTNMFDEKTVLFCTKVD